jgi:hypothetical protein
VDIPPWAGRRARDALARVKAKGSRQRLPCRRCGEPIDYHLTYPSPWSCSVGHILSRHDRPELTWDPANWAPEHLQCNLEGDNGPARGRPDLGVVAW